MYLFSFITYPNKKQKEDDYVNFQDEQNWYLSALSKNGQIVIESCNTILLEDKFITYFLAPDKDSLEIKNENKYVKEFYQKLIELCKCEPKLECLGKSADYESPCNCKASSWYMLYTDYSINESPVVCGDCGKSIPLYKLPKIFGEDEYYSVIGWQKAYKAYDRAFMEGFGERFSYKQLSKVTSDLSQKGRDICREFEKVMGKPFYYYIFRYNSPHKSVCPECAIPWKLKNDTLFIDYWCESCRLVADKI